MLRADETPAPLTTAPTSAESCGNPHVYPVRPRRGIHLRRGGPDLLRRAGNRTKASIAPFGILDGFAGVLRCAMSSAAARELRRWAPPCSCNAWPTCTGTSITLTPSTRYSRSSPAAAMPSRGQGCGPLPGTPASPACTPPPARLRHSYDQAVAFAISVNLSALATPPRLILTRRLKRKASQVWLFATRFDVPATNNVSENARPGLQARRENQRLLTHLRDPPAPLPHPLLPRQPLAATATTPSPPSARPQRELLDAPQRA